MQGVQGLGFDELFSVWGVRLWGFAAQELTIFLTREFPWARGRTIGHSPFASPRLRQKRGGGGAQCD